MKTSTRFAGSPIGQSPECHLQNVLQGMILYYTVIYTCYHYTDQAFAAFTGVDVAHNQAEAASQGCFPQHSKMILEYTGLVIGNSR